MMRNLLVGLVLLAAAPVACGDSSSDDGGDDDVSTEDDSTDGASDDEAADEDGSSEIPGDLGDQIDTVIDELDDEQRQCIEDAPDVVTALATCSTREQLAETRPTHWLSAMPELSALI